MRAAFPLAVLLVAAACATSDEATPAPSTPSGPTRAELEAVDPATDPEPAPMPRALTDATLRLSAIDADEGEDGRGALVAAPDPIALDVERDAGWPGRAEDPSLHVGGLRFERYAFPAVTTLRFVAADQGALPMDAPVELHWGDDADATVALGTLSEARP
ncbi:MAG TPA: hypothetical protein RMH85_24015 [Polyangiaceae bacterium LLY-WYZ-15_(1-7)]|nr:hypothetical protein [Polyangiaceae bacterium LLY-WYZ-15_(1-7)]HJL11564.1 hypothetical protein [Polyangiaceae bacterium LLY-WYZ-15_(1-7)]HJL32987.1 hypothetical protein [Polyangiaceae bacterium LLY-WYZ-15_(1-7)]HJL38160.1 hypothetical protein [Polyangiaceae bacterium LLY-WYZ-15_(1-7)]